MPAAGAAASPVPQLDSSQPLVLRVGTLGPAYWAWVGRPEKGHPRFFSSSLLERCTKTPWWVVPCLWAPVYVAVAAHARAAYAWPLPHLAALLALGVVLWQLLEYAIHRFVFHAPCTSYWGITLHFLFHGCHHKYPMDHLRLVMPPVPALAFALVVYHALHVALPPSLALPLFAGAGMGYVAYDTLHYAIHHGSSGGGGGSGASGGLGPLLRLLRRKHLHHHYKDTSTGYGISSVLFDYVFQTQA